MIKLKTHIMNEMKVLYPAALNFVDNSIDLNKSTIE